MKKDFYNSLTKEQKKIFNKCKKEADEFFCRPKGYVLHHVDITLKHEDIGRYIQWRPEDLVMMSMSDHAKWHSKYDENWKKKISESHKGRHLSEETRKKLSKVHKGNTNMLGKHHSEETRKKMSEAAKGNTVARGTHYYNNGVVEVRRFECPEGFVPGRLLKKN